jgi:SAM-dependent methyltransferase
VPIWRLPARDADNRVSAESFRPSSDQFGATVGTVERCRVCGHASVASPPDGGAVAEAYEWSEDAVSVREEPGQVATARRALDAIERQVVRGRLLDVGCWTGSVLVAAEERGWDALGVEPSVWASKLAAARGVSVLHGDLATHADVIEPVRAAVMCDVIEHLADPSDALATLHELIEPGGVLYLTVPDAGSALARVLGRRWWAVLPMHLHYFTRRSMATLLRRNGFEPVEVRTHPKAFSALYYAERFGAFVPGGNRLSAWVSRRWFASRVISPNFYDRMAVLAVRCS